MARPRRREDAHHILFTKKSYSTGYAKALRNHAWLKVLIPRDTLHRQIHRELQCVPVPGGEECGRVFELLVRLEALGRLNPEAGIEERLDFLIENIHTKATRQALCKQREIVQQFYK